MNKFNIGNYKLPHINAFPVKKVQNRIPKPSWTLFQRLLFRCLYLLMQYHKDGHAPKLASMDRAPELSQDLKDQLH